MDPRGTAVAISALLCAAVLGAPGCGGSDDSTPTQTGAEATQEQAADQPLSPTEERGRELFVENCGSCHTLDAAGTTGSIGPPLDEVPLDRAEIREAIEIGGRGSGNMPPNLVSGEDAEAVSTFVANTGPGV